jgi:hypothetical protein
MKKANGQGSMPASGFQTVFSITQSDHSISHTELSIIAEIKMLATVVIVLTNPKELSYNNLPIKK